MTSRDLVLVSLFTAIIVALGILPPIPLAFSPVPITAQTLGVMLAGLVLGRKRGALAVLLLFVLVAIGLPVLSGGRGGLATFVSPTAGFLIGFLPAAYVCGAFAEQAAENQSPLRQTVGFFIAAIAGGIVVEYFLGIAWLAFGVGMGISGATAASIGFLPGDLIKAGLAALAARAVMLGYPLLPKKAGSSADL
ncbi:biotin transporter BioY [Martelella endophytica]|uniref:Biotin transporter n=1 Tax=Martelella endophytica TaxID=1486262 RepID=A0A0D5LR17_MAREN|nr:biotin transporter BioY [Martelella endophytica]AJY46212.1 biotin biosynthesis protein BioC [Martelella endophytica]